MDDKNTQVLNTEEEFIDSYEDNESMSTLLNSVKAGGETLQTFTDKKLSETVKYTGTKPVYPVAAEVDDWECDGWVKTGTTEPVYALDANIPLYQDISGTNTFTAHYKDVSDFLIKKAKNTTVDRNDLKFQDDTIINAYPVNLKGFFTNFYCGGMYDFETKQIILRNYRGWNLDNDPVEEGKKQEDEEGLPGVGFIMSHNGVQPSYTWKRNISHVEVDIPNFKGRIHKQASWSEYGYICSAGLWVNSSGSSPRGSGGEKARITNYEGQVLDCLSWKEGQQGDLGNLYVDPVCDKLIAYMPDLYGCIKNGPKEIYYYKLKNDKKYSPSLYNYFYSDFPYTCILWDAGHLNEITTHYQINTSSNNLRTLILHYGDGTEEGEEGIVSYGIEKTQYDIPSECKVYVPSSLISAYQADPKWNATGVEFLAIENCDPIEGHPEKDWIRKDMEACLWRFEAYNKLETIKEKRLFLKSCAGKSNDYSIPNEYKFDYPDWYWDIDDADEGEITYGEINTNSRTKNVSNYYTHKYITNNFTMSDLNTILNTNKMTGLGFLFQNGYNNFLYDLTSFTIPSSVTKMYPQFLNLAALPNLTNIVIEPDQLDLDIYVSGDDRYTPFDSYDSNMKKKTINMYYKSLQQLYNIPYYNLVFVNKITFYSSDPTTTGINLYINNDLLTEIELTDSFNEIQFCKCIKKVTINTNTFNCSASRQLEQVIFAKDITQIPQYAFRYTGIKSITLPNTVAVINKFAFEECKDLQSVVLNEGLTTIDKYAFEYAGANNEAFSINFPSTLSSIGEDCFSRSALTTCNLLGCSSLQIGDNAFTGCEKLTSVTLPTNITSIPTHCFSNTNITSISFPASATTFNNMCCYQCANLQNIYFQSEELNFMSNCFSYGKQSKNIYFPSMTSFCNATHANRQTFMGTNSDTVNTVYINNTKLEDVSFPDDITELKPYTFTFVEINSINNWNKVTKLGKGTFQEATINQEVIIPPNVIGSTESSNFYNTHKLTNITFAEGKTVCTAGVPEYYKFNILSQHSYTKTLTLPSTITSIEDYFIRVYFQNMYDTIIVKIKATTPPALASNAFSVNAKYPSKYYFRIQVPSNSVNDYKTATNWSTLAEYIEGYEEED